MLRWIATAAGGAVEVGLGLSRAARHLEALPDPEGAAAWLVLSILGAATGRTPEDAASGYTQYGPLKTDTAEAVIELIRPIQQRCAELAADPAETARLLDIGAQRAQTIAAATLERSQAAMGLLPRTPRS